MTAAARRNATKRVLEVLEQDAGSRLADMLPSARHALAESLVRAVIGQPDGKVRR